MDPSVPLCPSMRRGGNSLFFAPIATGLLALVLSSCDALVTEPKPTLDPDVGAGLESLKGLIQPDAPKQEKPTIPVRWNLLDREGRELDAMIIGKSGASITLIRIKDGKRFDLPIDRLSEADRVKVNRLDGKTAPSKHPLESAFYRMQQSRLDEIDARMMELNVILADPTSKIKRRSASSEIQRLATERSKVLADMSELERF